ncbi:MAG: hypothetical protein AABY87_10775 [bacterium]
MFAKKVSLSKELFERASRFAMEKGYADLSEWVTDLLEEEMKRDQGKPSSGGKDDDVKKRLQGLGYIS